MARSLKNIRKDKDVSIGLSSITGNTLQLPTSATDPIGSSEVQIYFNSSSKTMRVFNGTTFTSVNVKDGSSPSLAAESAVYLKDIAGINNNGTYYINWNGTPTQIYCDMQTNGGGWMLFACADGNAAWFPGNTGTTAWDQLSYSYGTYSASGNIGEYWKDYNGMNVSDLMFVTSNGTYWIHILLSDVYLSPNGNSHTVTAQGTSNNFNNTYEANTKVTIMHRAAQLEDPWINAGNIHGGGGDTSTGYDYMFWGENSHVGHDWWKTNASGGGIRVYVR